MNRSGVWSFLKHYEETGTIQGKQRSGRPSALSRESVTYYLHRNFGHGNNELCHAQATGVAVGQREGERDSASCLFISPKVTHMHENSSLCLGLAI